MLTSCEKITLIIRAGMIAMNNTAMLTSKYNMVLKFIVGNTAPPFITDVSFIVFTFYYRNYSCLLPAIDSFGVQSYFGCF